MNVFDNVAFGLKLRKMPKGTIKEKVEDVARTLGLTEQLEKTPSEMSGGQRQRVALGRAMVQDSKVFLMDEPLSNLDAKLRNKMRLEILRLHRQLGITTIYVTHDQVEAMTMADRIVVMNKGIIQQIGSPRELYLNPKNMFVATFIGEPEINLIKGTINKDKFINETIEIQLDACRYKNLAKYDKKEVILGIRPEHIELVKESNLSTEIELTEMRGDIQILVSKIGDKEISAKTTSSIEIQLGQTVFYEFDKANIHLFDIETENRIG
jgi:multiple sugar transport system ATP-binding protein